MATLEIAAAREQFGATLDRVVEGKERIILTIEGKPVAVLAPLAPAGMPPPDPAWQQRLDQAVAGMRNEIPPGTTPEEIEADITAISDELRRERLARRD